MNYELSGKVSRDVAVATIRTSSGTRVEVQLRLQGA